MPSGTRAVFASALSLPLSRVRFPALHYLSTYVILPNARPRLRHHDLRNRTSARNLLHMFNITGTAPVPPSITIKRSLVFRRRKETLLAPETCTRPLQNVTLNKTAE